MLQPLPLITILKLFFRDLLYSSDIEVSYFAAGIAAHLSSLSTQVWSWTVNVISREQLIQDLVSILNIYNRLP